MTTALTFETHRGMRGWDSLSEVLAYAERVGGRVANLVEIVERPAHLYDGKGPYVPLSEEIVGIDKHGKYADRGALVFVTIHGLGVLTPEVRQIAARDGYAGNHSANLDMIFPDRDVLTVLLNERSLPDNRAVKVVGYDEYQEDGLPDCSLLHAIVRNRQQASRQGHFDVAELVDNPQVLTYCGGRRRSENLLLAWKRTGIGAFGAKNMLSYPRDYFADSERTRPVATVANPVYGPCDGFYGNWPLSNLDKNQHRYLVLTD